MYRIVVSIVMVSVGLAAAAFGSALPEQALWLGGLVLTAAGLALFAYSEMRRRRGHRW
jgi:hypothetical protein